MGIQVHGINALDMGFNEMEKEREQTNSKDMQRFSK